MRSGRLNCTNRACQSHSNRSEAAPVPDTLVSIGSANNRSLSMGSSLWWVQPLPWGRCRKRIQAGCTNRASKAHLDGIKLPRDCCATEDGLSRMRARSDRNAAERAAAGAGGAKARSPLLSEASQLGCLRRRRSLNMVKVVRGHQAGDILANVVANVRQGEQGERLLDEHADLLDTKQGGRADEGGRDSHPVAGVPEGDGEDDVPQD